MTSHLPPAEAASPAQETADERERLHQLRSLLLGPEQAQLAALHQRLHSPEDLSQNIAEALALRAKQDHKLQSTLQPLIEEALRISVARDPKMLATSLFPIIGEAVRKAVAHALQGMFDSLNLMLDRGLSLDSWKWRFEAWRTGRSFGEVALTHSLNYRVEQVFLIHRETGLLLRHVSFDTGIVEDADLMSGMLTAIQDFVRDSFTAHKADDLGVMEVGTFKLWLQHSPLLLLAAVVSGQPPPELRDVLIRELEAIHAAFAPILQPFNGDTESISAAEPHLRRCLLSAQKVQRQKSHKTLWIALTLLTAFAILIGLRIRDTRRWNRYVADLRTQPGLVVIDQQRHWFSYSLTGLRDPLAPNPYDTLASHHVPADRVAAQWQPYMSLDPRFETTRRLEAQKSLIDRQAIHFDLNSAQLPISQFALLESILADLNTLRQAAEANHTRIHLDIFGHTDRTGREEHNVELSQSRAQAVASALEFQGIPAEIMRAAGVADANPGHTGPIAYPQELDRRVTFRVTLAPPTEPRP